MTMNNKLVNTKLDKYIKKYCDNIVVSENSIYYNFGGHILRVSNHVGKNSDGTVSIIIDKKNNYILHDHKFNTISVITYEDAKTIVKSISIYNSIFSIHSNMEMNDVYKRINGVEQNIVNQKISKLKQEKNELNKTINALKMNFKKYKKTA